LYILLVSYFNILEIFVFVYYTFSLINMFIVIFNQFRQVAEVDVSRIWRTLKFGCTLSIWYYRHSVLQIAIICLYEMSHTRTTYFCSSILFWWIQSRPFKLYFYLIMAPLFSRMWIVLRFRCNTPFFKSSNSMGILSWKMIKINSCGNVQ